MKKLSLDALKQRAGVVASEDLLATISGGTENACHDDYEYKPDSEVMKETEKVKDNIPTWPKPIIIKK